MANPEDVIREFCEAVERGNLPEILDLFSEDAVYHNIPVAPVQGRAGIESTLKMFMEPGGETEFEILHLAVRGNVVLPGRIDRLTVQGKRVELPVMGAFEVDPDGKIAAWRDYFDMGQFAKQIS